MENKYIVSDVDGIITDGKFYYDENGKAFKAYSSDFQAIRRLEQLGYTIQFITADTDAKGMRMTERRVQDMDCPLFIMSSIKRLQYMVELQKQEAHVIYLGDNVFDAPILAQANTGVTVRNACPQAKKAADLVLDTDAGIHVFAHLLDYIEWKWG